MRQVGLSDLHHAARVVQTVPVETRKKLCAQLVWRAHVADKYVKRLRKLHPLWGDGSLRAVAMQHPQASIRSGDRAQYLSAMAVVLDVLRTS